MPHQLWTLKNNKLIHLSQITGAINWRSNMDELGDEISFSTFFDSVVGFPKNPCELGDLVILKNDKEITRGIIVEESKNGKKSVSYSAFDFAFYLNKSNAIYQFNNIVAHNAVRRILQDFNVPIGSIVAMPTKITHIFNNATVSSILKDIVEMVEQDQGEKYLMEMRQGKLYIEKQKDLIIKGTFKLASNQSTEDLTKVILSASRKRSIVDMKNAIQIVSEDSLITTAVNDSLVKKYGRLQQVVSIDEEEKKKAKQIAQNHLRDLGKISEDVSIELMGNDSFRAGRLFQITEPLTGINGTFLIKSVDHSISNGIHTMSLDLGAKR